VEGRGGRERERDASPAALLSWPACTASRRRLGACEGLTYQEGSQSQWSVSSHTTRHRCRCAGPSACVWRWGLGTCTTSLRVGCNVMPQPE
jgi:hypothetical protein